MSIEPGQFARENPPKKRLIALALVAVMFLAGLGIGLQSRKGEKAEPAEDLPRQTAPDDSWELQDLKDLESNTSNGSPLFPESGDWAEQDDSQAEDAVTDARPNQRVMIFKNRDDFLRYRDAARQAGIAVLGSIDGLHALLLGTADDALLGRLAQETGVEPVQESNAILTLPEPPPSRELAESGAYEPLGIDALKKMGIDPNENWGQGVKVAILDGGLVAHDVFANGQPTLIDLFGAENPMGEEGLLHGTAVASLIGGDLAGKIGIAPASELELYRVMDSQGLGDSFVLADAILRAVDGGARIINMSLAAPPGSGQSSVLNAALDYAMNNGVLVVAAAGNDGVQGLSYPASYEGVISVGAVDAQGASMPFSNTGYPTLSAGGYGVPAAGNQPQSVIGFTGTSAAAPVISGMVAGILSDNPGMSPHQAVNLLEDYADDLGAPGVDEVYGVGVANPLRVSERDGNNVLDLAASGAVISGVDGQNVQVTITAQNRGNTVAPQGLLEIEVGGIKDNLSLSGMEPREVRPLTVDIPIDRLTNEGELIISFQTSTGFRADARNENDKRTKVLKVR